MKKINLPKGTVVPNHISIIMDGNRRWARARGLAPVEGHKAGYAAMKEIMRSSRGLGVHTLSLWGFSTENWERPAHEVAGIMQLVYKALQELKSELVKEDIRFIHLGRKDRLPSFVLKQIKDLEDSTKDNKSFVLNLALDYGGKDEIVRAVKKIIDSGVPSTEIDEKLIDSYLDTKDQPYPYPDLFIRTSGEQRTSGFLPWQSIYSEFLWIDKHLPDISVQDVYEGILDYSRRRRRFGLDDKESHFTFMPSVAAKLEINWWRLSKIPKGEFASYVASHIKEQWGVSKDLAKRTAILMCQAIADQEQSKWVAAKSSLVEFYRLIRDEVKLAFEPKLVAELQISLWKNSKDFEKAGVSAIEESSRQLLSEVYRISDFQARKAAHLMALAEVEKQKAVSGKGEEHWGKAEEYLTGYYKALKDRIA